MAVSDARYEDMCFFRSLFMALFIITLLGLVITLMVCMSSDPIASNSASQQAIDACIRKGGVPIMDRYEFAYMRDCKFPTEH